MIRTHTAFDTSDFPIDVKFETVSSRENLHRRAEKDGGGAAPEHVGDITLTLAKRPAPSCSIEP